MRSFMGDRSGFTLIEALIATMLATMVVGMVTSIMVAQGRSYGDASRRTELQSSVRAAVDLIREELQSVPRDGITTSLTDRLVFRQPISIGSVCLGGSGGRGGSAASVYLPGPGGGISNTRVSGWGYRDPDDPYDSSSPSDWNWDTDLWASLNVGGGTPKATCFTQGADTIGGGTDYYSLSGSLSSSADTGDLVMLYSLIEFQFADSALRPGTKALFRKEASGSLVEFAAGLTSDSKFEYRREGQSSFQASITGAGQRDDIVEIRVTVEAERQDQIAGAPSDYLWQLRIPLRNTPCDWPCP